MAGLNQRLVGVVLRLTLRAFQPGDDVLVRPVRGLGPVSGHKAVQNIRQVGGLGQGTVHVLPARKGTRAVVLRTVV